MTATSRLYFWDTARAVLILLVVALHAAAAYCTVIPWWHVRNAATGPAFDLLLSMLDGFLMPTLFFIAGCFAPGSLARSGPRGFFRAKVWRFTPTLLLYMLTLLPLMTYVGYVSRTPEPMGFFTYLMAWLASGADLGVHLYSTVADGLAARDMLSPHHLWFLVVLVGLFGGLALWRTIFPDTHGATAATAATENTPRPVRLPVLLAAGLGMAAACTLVALGVPDGGWIRATALVMVQPTRLPLYVGFFALGAYTAARGGLSSPWPGAWWLWLPVAGVSLGVMFAAYPAVLGPGRGPLPLVCAYYLGRTFLCLGVVGLLAALSRPGATQTPAPGRLSRTLAASSYHVYLLHMPVVVILQYALLDAALSMYAKFGAVWLGSVAVCVLASRAWRGVTGRAEGWRTSRRRRAIPGDAA
ncbi:acyltransferase family protein [Desulfovibrio sulfodismutans]|uniref:Acyltransferase family protein n=1 Tax=Desulfolutivibrio sulfodismutans TaxID=63561 RepID=A0A7K3NMM0_9BACT|nr:acyltransferase family protein [Desulfolutivibrio sulfodismutans]NDY57444.1 acyltransferase family protein [Desulfolutivibrio sulfodismutans]QLA12474.1 acyltransferase family protein [Desulfolutivibrio sulfodismutans DSM 3696]